MRSLSIALMAAVAGVACASQSMSPPGEPSPASAIPAVQGDVRSMSGIKVIDIVEGGGDPAVRGKCLYAEYTGWLAGGTRLDSSRDPGGSPAAFVLGKGMVMSGWEIGFGGMRVGGRRRLFVPYAQAYGERGHPPLIPARSALVFDVELIAVMEPEGASSTCPSLKR
ncbi:MAG: peptidylprolyl isomerase FKBP-type [Gemmatimonadetes bacterium]|nr:peptidylprolyl isomerase FKBP-type [Gemmatimonadota bacterium]